MSRFILFFPRIIITTKVWEKGREDKIITWISDIKGRLKMQHVLQQSILYTYALRAFYIIIYSPMYALGEFSSLSSTFGPKSKRGKLRRNLSTFFNVNFLSCELLSYTTIHKRKAATNPDTRLVYIQQPGSHQHHQRKFVWYLLCRLFMCFVLCEGVGWWIVAYYNVLILHNHNAMFLVTSTFYVNLVVALNAAAGAAHHHHKHIIQL